MTHNRRRLVFVGLVLIIFTCKADDSVKKLNLSNGNEASAKKSQYTTAKNIASSIFAKVETTSIISTFLKTTSTPAETEDGLETVLPENDDSAMLETGPNMRESIGLQKALEWLREKRSPDFGWGNDTHMVILSKELAGPREASEMDGHLQTISELENALSEKQMEIEILNMITPHHLYPKPIDSDRLARYILALSSLCKNPRSFHGHDLVSTLQHHEPTADYEFALATLAACSSATHVRKRQIRRLLDIASGEVNNVDTMAMVLLALRCIVTDHRHRHLQHFVRRPARGLASLQGPRGGFGSLRSTALAMQALQDLDLDPSGKWDQVAASKWILDRQMSDGGWEEEPIVDGQDPPDCRLTAEIILALGHKGLGAVRALNCEHEPHESLYIGDNSENGETKIAAPVGLTSSAEENEAKNVSYSYTLWVGTNVTEVITLTLTSPRNTSFFKAMTQAAEQDPRFSFDARMWANGHYVHTISGKKEEPRGYNFWILYRLPEFPEISSPPGNQLIAPVGVDELLVEDGEHYLYWYKKL